MDVKPHKVRISKLETNKLIFSALMYHPQVITGSLIPTSHPESSLQEARVVWSDLRVQAAEPVGAPGPAGGVDSGLCVSRRLGLPWTPLRLLVPCTLPLLSTPFGKVPSSEPLPLSSQAPLSGASQAPQVVWKSESRGASAMGDGEARVLV